jgi:hypothetical protein
MPGACLHAGCSCCVRGRRESKRGPECQEPMPGAVSERERVLFIGTEFSILYKSVYPPAGAPCPAQIGRVLLSTGDGGHA